jgi:hypothetical protein
MLPDAGGVECKKSTRLILPGPSINGGPFLYTYAKFCFESSELETKHKTDSGAMSERAESFTLLPVVPGPASLFLINGRF